MVCFSFKVVAGLFRSKSDCMAVPEHHQFHEDELLELEIMNAIRM